MVSKSFTLRCHKPGRVFVKVRFLYPKHVIESERRLTLPSFSESDSFSKEKMKLIQDTSHAAASQTPSKRDFETPFVKTGKMSTKADLTNSENNA